MAIVRDFKIGLIMLDFISIRLAKCETLAKYCNHKHCRWLSEDPALNEYIPKAPIDDKAKKHNENLPGMGGVYNTVNLQLYHYAENNPVKYVDPTGMWIDNDDGTYTAEKGDTLYSLYGEDWQKKIRLYPGSKNPSNWRIYWTKKQPRCQWF